MRAAIGLLAILAAAAPARAEDNPACARFEDPLAYNACLASQGPKANAVRKGTGGRAGPATAPARRPAEAFQNVERRHGRVHMEFRLR